MRGSVTNRYKSVKYLFTGARIRQWLVQHLALGIWDFDDAIYPGLPGDLKDLVLMCFLHGTEHYAPGGGDERLLAAARRPQPLTTITPNARLAPAAPAWRVPGPAGQHIKPHKSAYLIARFTGYDCANCAWNCHYCAR
jgi:hypothetical protein